MIGGTDWVVILIGVAAIAWVNWYFFVAGRTAAPSVALAAGHGGPGIGEQVIVVDGGYSPATISVKVGQPVRLIFDRRDSGNCSDEVVLPDFGVRRFLPTGERTVIEVTPPSAGRYEFMCGMSMHRGALVAVD